MKVDQIVVPPVVALVIAIRTSVVRRVTAISRDAAPAIVHKPSVVRRVTVRNQIVHRANVPNADRHNRVRAIVRLRPVDRVPATMPTGVVPTMQTSGTTDRAINGANAGRNPQPVMYGIRSRRRSPGCWDQINQIGVPKPERIVAGTAPNAKSSVYWPNRKTPRY
ncbi:hypothetical protein GCM10023187_47990 [Nibrella viscosa]|uniref:Secreted protein n=1 Tax=Nibrella viscosa TaxID=1084524 RepID=A0ABP8KVB9_9BACT